MPRAAGSTSIPIRPRTSSAEPVPQQRHRRGRRSRGGGSLRRRWRLGLGGGIDIGFYGYLIPRFNPDGSSLALSGSILEGNRASGGGADRRNRRQRPGGALAVLGEDTATVAESLLDSNSARGGSGQTGGNGFGGGLYVDAGRAPVSPPAPSLATRPSAADGSGGGSDGEGIGGGVYYLGTFTVTARPSSAITTPRPATTTSSRREGCASRRDSALRVPVADASRQRGHDLGVWDTVERWVIAKPLDRLTIPRFEHGSWHADRS